MVSVNDEDEFGNKKENSLTRNYLNKNQGKVIEKIKRKFICSAVNNLPLGCYQNNIVDLWKYNSTVVRGLTEEEILMRINNVKLRFVNIC